MLEPTERHVSLAGRDGDPHPLGAFLLGKLQEHDWNVSETARTLRMPRSNLYKKIERYGLSRAGAGGGV